MLRRGKLGEQCLEVRSAVPFLQRSLVPGNDGLPMKKTENADSPMSVIV
jgi:hypothetical protein